MIDLSILARLNAPTRRERLASLEDILKTASFPPQDPRMINNHIHTAYSFSPYSPGAAVFAARSEGLATCGIVDHDSIAGAREFIEAGRLVGIPTTIGIEARVSMADTAFEQRRTNNPDQTGVSYMVMHAVPHGSIDAVQDYFGPLRERRDGRSRAMLDRINDATGLALDFERHVLSLSMRHDGGSVTERHLMLALARELIRLGREPRGGDVFYEYDLVGRLKKELIPKVYIPATEECPAFAEYISFARDMGAVLCYAYLGDVGNSVTGDKSAQKFEDDYIDELFLFLRASGIEAVTYMPTRNTPAQLSRVRALCERHGMLQISGEDINSPRQSFVIEAMKDPQYANLIDSTWEIIRREHGEKMGGQA